MSTKYMKYATKRFRGAAMTELLVTMLGIVPLVMGTVQSALIYNAKEVLNYATYEAARAGSVNHAQKSPMKQALARGLVPLYGGGKDNSTLATSYGEALVDVYAPVVPFTKFGSSTDIQILNPTRQAFQDHGVTYRGQQQIPNEHLKYKERTVGTNSGVNLQDANILKIKVTYGYKLFVPVINKMIGQIMLFADPDNAQYYLADPPRLPITSVATVRMQSNAYFDDNEEYPGGNGGTVPGGGGNGGTVPGGSEPGQGGDSNPNEDDLTDTNEYDDTNPPADAPQTCEEAGTCDAGNPTACGGGAGNQSTNTASVGVGNPINVVTGNKYQKETDIVSLPGKLGLEFVRHYNSQSPYKGSLGYKWRHTYDVRLNRKNPNSIYIEQADGRRVVFENRLKDDENHMLANVASDGWLVLHDETVTWHWHNGRKLKFDREGRLNYIVEKAGQTIHLTYNSDGHLIQVNDPQGRSLAFNYYPNNRIKKILDPHGNSISYTYDFVGNLSTVTYSDKSTRNYHYEDKRFVHHLTGLTDGRGVRFATWKYDNKGRANLSTHADGVEKVTLKYLEGTTEVTNSKGVTSTYYTDKINNIPVVTRIDGPGCSACGNGDNEYKYNKFVQLITKKEKSGITTHYQYDELLRLKSVSRSTRGKPHQELFSYTYKDKTHNIESLSRPSVVKGKKYTASIKYNKNSQITETIEKGWAPAIYNSDKKIQSIKSVERKTNYKYSMINGHSVLTEIDGPLPNGKLNSPEDSDISRFIYGNDDSYVTAVILPGSQQNKISYDLAGRVSQVVMSDGRKILYEYDTRNNIKSIAKDGNIQQYHYDNDGRLIEIGKFTENGYTGLTKYGYDKAGRNNWMARSLGLIEYYTYDSESNIIKATKQTAKFKQIHEFKYDAYNRMIASIDPKGAVKKLTYNSKGLVQELIDPLNRVNKYSYDEYGGLIQVLEAANSPQERIVKFKSDLRGNTQAVIGPNGAATQYFVDDFGRNLAINSPDSGLKIKKYDEANRLIASIDALGNQLNYQYDHVGRLLSQSVVTQNSSNTDVLTTFNWKGDKLAAVNHPNQTESYDYDDLQRMISKTTTLKLVNGKEVSYLTEYTWDKTTGQIRSKTLPDGSVLHYEKNGQNQLVGLMRSRGHFSSENLITNITRDLVGLNGYTYGNGIRASIQRSTEGTLARIVHRLPKLSQNNTYAVIDSLLPYIGIEAANSAINSHAHAGSEESSKDNLNKELVDVLQLPKDPSALIDHRYLWDRTENLRFTRNYGVLAGKILPEQNSYLYDLHDQLIISSQNLQLIESLKGNKQVSTGNNIANSKEISRYFYDDAGNRLLSQKFINNPSSLNNTVKVYYQGETNRATSVLSGKNYDSNESIKYDIAGNPVSHGDRKYLWDPLGRLINVKQDNKNNSQYRYNHRGERISKEVFVDGKHETQHMLYEGRKIIAELDKDGKILRQYVYFAEQPIAVIDSASGKQLQRHNDSNVELLLSQLGDQIEGILGLEKESISYLHLNHLGAPELATDEKATPVWQASYSPFGEIINSSESSQFKLSSVTTHFKLNLRLPGQYEDEETGLYYNDRRYYDPERGQYLTSDPLGLRAGINTYAYVNNNPLKYIDPTGLILFAFDGTKNDVNDKTNVHLFSQAYRDNDYTDDIRLTRIAANKPYYISGVGTGDDAGWRDAGFAGSMIERRMIQLNRLDKYVETKFTVESESRTINQDNPLMITLDVIGFSRGAAAARDFVNHVVDRANSGYYRNLPGVDGSCVGVEVRFMGLFDTVLSHAPAGIDLRIPEAVQHASHAVAVNEHRDEFPLESIEPSFADIGFSSNRIERGFVGAHADIGGGYNGDNNHEISTNPDTEETFDGGDLSDVALNWMVEQAEENGVLMDILDLEYLEVTNPIVHDETVDPLWILGGDDRQVRYPNAPDNPYPLSRQCLRNGRNCPSNVHQKTAQIEGMTHVESLPFITEVTRTPPGRQCSRNGRNCPNNPPANHFGTVDMTAYSAWLSENYNFTLPWN